jgi:hypothetical protein
MDAWMRRARAVAGLAAALLLTGCGGGSATAALGSGYPVHRAITATMFWAGEKPAKGTANLSSAWDEKWAEHFGGSDDPKKAAAGFEPRENRFYVALPYNDLAKGGRKAGAEKRVPWANQKQEWGKWEPMCKDRWVRVSCGQQVCYAQWEDVGPFETDDAAYVFGDGSVRPKNKENEGAGIDVSPAVSAYLGVGGMGKVDWQFVEKEDVPAGPWSEVVTGAERAAKAGR